jgi:hypothetical protein
LAVAAAAPSSYKPEYKPPTYSAPAYSKPAYSAPAYSAPAYSAPAYSAPAYPAPAYSAPAYKDNKYADITITSQSDERNLDGSSQWRLKLFCFPLHYHSKFPSVLRNFFFNFLSVNHYLVVL